MQQKTDQQITETNKKIEFFFACTMSDYMFSNPEKLTSGKFWHFHNTGSLRRELRHLRDIGYIKMKSK